MKKYLAAIIVLAASHNLAAAQSGDHAQAIKLWTGPEAHCRNCHGVKGEGGFGPDLAGRKIDRRAVYPRRAQPWGIMPAYIESQISDNELALLARYFEEHARGRAACQMALRGAGRRAARAGGFAHLRLRPMPRPDPQRPRSHLGAIDADFAWFKTMVYDHTTAMPEHEKVLHEPPPVRIRMGNYSPTRMWESQLRDHL